jgi:hypothetical protein
MMRFAMSFLPDSPRIAGPAIHVSRMALKRMLMALKRMLARSNERKGTMAMAQISLSATPKGNGFQGTIT